MRMVEAGAGGRTAISTESRHGRSSNGGDVAAGVHHADAVVLAVGDVEIVLRIERDVPRAVQGGLAGRTAVTSEVSIASHRGNRTGSVHLADPVVVGVGDIDTALREGDALGQR